MSNLYEMIKSPKEALQLIVDIGFDYDGVNSTEALMDLIDEIVEIAKIGLDVEEEK